MGNSLYVRGVPCDLSKAAQAGNQDLVRQLLTSGEYEVNCKNCEHDPIIHQASENGDDELIRMLVSDFGADVNYLDSFNLTTVAYAAATGQLDTVRMLITEFGCDPCKTQELDGLTQPSRRVVNCRLSSTEYWFGLYGSTPLHLAVVGGHAAVIRALICEFNCSPNIKGFNDRTPLHLACVPKGLNLDIVRMLVSEFGADVNARDKFGNIPLHIAAATGKAELVRTFITEFGCSPHVIGFQGQTLLHFACLGGNKELVDLLISEYKISPLVASQVGDLPIHSAALGGNSETVRELVSNHGTSVNSRNGCNQTPLHYAVCLLAPEKVIQTLVSELGADVNALDSRNRTPLMYATVTQNCLSINELVTECGCSPFLTDSEGRTLLHYACIKFDLTELTTHNILRLLQSIDFTGAFHFGLRYVFDFRISADTENVVMCFLVSECDLDPMVPSHTGDLPLHVAASTGFETAARSLVSEYDCSVDYANYSGRTPLHVACLKGRLALVHMLIAEYGADPNVCDSDGNTPLHLAVLGGNTDVVVALITEFNCNLFAKGERGRTLLHHACSIGHSQLVELLVERFKCYLLSVDVDGDTPLHLAAQFRNIEVVELLLYKYGTPVMFKNKTGLTARDVAATDEVKDIIDNYLPSNNEEIYSQSRLSSVMQVFVVGHPGSGKTTLVKALQSCTGWKYFLVRKVSEQDIDLHTAGIIPSRHSLGGDSGEVMFYDFAGDPEYYSSHAAILEVLSSPGCHVFLLVVDLSRDQDQLRQQLGHWITFISNNSKHPQGRSVVLIIGSHADVVKAQRQDPNATLACIRAFTFDQCNQLSGNLQVEDAFELDCRNLYSTNISKVLQRLKDLTSRNPPKEISPGAAILLKYLDRVVKPTHVTCKLATLFEFIRISIIHLPRNTKELCEIAQELHDIGRLIIVKSNSGDLKNHWLILEVSKVTRDIHEKLFSTSATLKRKRSWAISDDSSLQQHLQLGIIPDCKLQEILPSYISKECLIQLQYCQEFCSIDVLPDHSITDAEVHHNSSSFLFFPALLQLERAEVSWSAPEKLAFCRGCYVQCSGDFVCLSSRFIHVLLLRLAFRFAFPIPSRLSNTVHTDSPVQERERPCALETSVANCVNLYGHHCELWKYGMHWLMEEGVECLVEIVKGAKGVLVVARSENQFKRECDGVFSALVKEVREAKTEFCFSLDTELMLIAPDELNHSSLPEVGNLQLFKVSDVQKVISRTQNTAISITRRKSISYAQAQHIWLDSLWEEGKLCIHEVYPAHKLL